MQLLPSAREGNVFTGVCLSKIGLTDTGSLLGLVMVRSVGILLECFLVGYVFYISCSVSFFGAFLDHFYRFSLSSKCQTVKSEESGLFMLKKHLRSQ